MENLIVVLKSPYYNDPESPFFKTTENWTVEEIVCELRNRAYNVEGWRNDDIWDIDETNWRKYFDDIMFEYNLV